MKLSINALLNDTSVLNAENNFGFTAWVAHTKTLERRMSVLIPKIKFLVDSNIINGDENYVTFNNVSAVSGKGTYDDIRITTLTADEKYEEYLGGMSFQTWGFAEGGNAHLFLVDELEENKEDRLKFQSFADWKEMKNELRDNALLIADVRGHFNKNYVEEVVEVKVEKVKEVKAKKSTKKSKVVAEDLTSPIAKAMELAKAKMEAKAALAQLEVIE